MRLPSASEREKLLGFDADHTLPAVKSSLAKADPIQAERCRITHGSICVFQRAGECGHRIGLLPGCEDAGGFEPNLGRRVVRKQRNHLGQRIGIFLIGELQKRDAARGGIVIV
jgi:hypothetical protein